MTLISHWLPKGSRARTVTSSCRNTIALYKYTRYVQRNVLHSKSQASGEMNALIYCIDADDLYPVRHHDFKSLIEWMLIGFHKVNEELWLLKYSHFGELKKEWAAEYVLTLIKRIENRIKQQRRNVITSRETRSWSTAYQTGNWMWPFRSGNVGSVVCSLWCLLINIKTWLVIASETWTKKNTDILHMRIVLGEKRLVRLSSRYCTASTCMQLGMQAISQLYLLHLQNTSLKQLAVH